MKIWQLSDPYNYDFAQVGCRGTWSENPEFCPECGGSSQERIQPLVIEWQRGSDVVGDFSWPGLLNNVVVAERVALALRERFRRFELGPVEMYQKPKLKRSKHGARGKPRVWLPYEGPPLYDLWVTHWVGVDHERSTVFLERSRCSTCGKARYVLSGAERWDFRWDQERGERTRFRIPRGRGEGLFVRHVELDEADIFRVREFSAAMFCTDRVKEFIEESGFTNVDFFEVGDVV